MRYFFDTEFNENVRPIDLISIGIVREDEKEWYGVNINYSHYQAYTEARDPAEQYPILNSCNDWVKANVLPIIFQPNGPENAFCATVGPENLLRDRLVDFVGMDPYPEFWAYYGSYDWFLLTRMFKSFENMPSKWPQTHYDLHQYAKHVGMQRGLPPKFQPVHNALVDARWTKHAFERCKLSADSLPKGTWP